MNNKSAIFFLILIAFIVSNLSIKAQKSVDFKEVAPTSAPFLTITPESRAGAMAGTGVATTPDLTSQVWNSAKYSFLNEDMGASISVTPWLRKLVNDINLYYITFHKKLDKNQTFSASLRYFSLGTITFRQEAEGATYTGKPNEFALDAAYSRRLSDNFSASIALRYIRSDIMNGSGTEGVEVGNAYAADINCFYINDVRIGGYKGDFTAGFNIKNLGSKISYDGNNTQQFLPTTMRLGAGFNSKIDSYNKFGVFLDVERQMLAKNEWNEKDGKWVDRSDLSMTSSFFQSFGDFSPKDLHIMIGAEYWYAEQFAVRAGYYHEDESQGNRKHATVGVGVKFNMFNIDASYIIAVKQNNPLANTIRVTIGFTLDKLMNRR